MINQSEETENKLANRGRGWIYLTSVDQSEGERIKTDQSEKGLDIFNQSENAKQC
jgi:hypothetical protein